MGRAMRVRRSDSYELMEDNEFGHAATESYDDGFAEGLEDGIEDSNREIEEKKCKGLDDLHDIGYDAGYEEGYTEEIKDDRSFFRRLIDDL